GPARPQDRPRARGPPPARLRRRTPAAGDRCSRSRPAVHGERRRGGPTSPHRRSARRSARFARGAGAALPVPRALAGNQLPFTGGARVRALERAVAGRALGGLPISADVFDLGRRSAFLINVPTGGTPFAAAHRVLPADGNPEVARGGPGATTLAACVVLRTGGPAPGRRSARPPRARSHERAVLRPALRDRVPLRRSPGSRWFAWVVALGIGGRCAPGCRRDSFLP